MVAPDEHCRNTASVNGFSQMLYELSCLIVVLWIINAVSVEHYKIHIHILYMLVKRFKNMFALMNVIKHQCSKTVCIFLCRYKRI